MRRTVFALSGLLLVAVSATVAQKPDEAPSPSKAVAFHTDLRADSAAQVASHALYSTLQDLRRAQDRYFEKHGRYTAFRDELTGYVPMRDAHVYVTAGGDWFVVRGEIDGVVVHQMTVWRAGSAVLGGDFSAE